MANKTTTRLNVGVAQSRYAARILSDDAYDNSDDDDIENGSKQRRMKRGSLCYIQRRMKRGSLCYIQRRMKRGSLCYIQPLMRQA